jgi:hypothetical protein
MRWRQRFQRNQPTPTGRAATINPSSWCITEGNLATSWLPVLTGWVCRVQQDHPGSHAIGNAVSDCFPMSLHATRFNPQGLAHLAEQVRLRQAHMVTQREIKPLELA